MTYIPVALRRLVYRRARNRCEYCLFPDDIGFMPHEVDHIYAEKHGGQTVAGNLCLSCWVCNRHKGTDLTSFDPLTAEITVLFHPRRDIWVEHFRLQGATIEPTTPQARTTVQLLQLNKRERVDERQILISSGQYP